MAKEEKEEPGDLEAPVMRPIVWLGKSRRNIEEFLLDAGKLMGDELQLTQYGGMPKDAKPLRDRRRRHRDRPAA